ncbi:MAG: ATP-binding protein [Prevotella sp.]
MDNPFVTSGYAGPEYFCDRVEETKTLTELLVNGNNVALISPRRLGKTDLIRHCFGQPEILRHYYTFIIDIYATDSVADFVNVFGKSILDALKPLGRKAWERFLMVLRSVRSEISFDINNNPVWGIGVGATVAPEITLDEIFTYLATADRRCFVAIDEFQQVTRYNAQRNIEAMLRTYIQRCPNAHFVFSGSQRHLMGEIFATPSRPFYQSTTLFNLHVIPMDKYCAFAETQFAKNGARSITRDAVETIYRRFFGITASIQKMMNILYMKTPPGGCCTVDQVDAAIVSYLQLSSDTYEALLGQMSERQRNVLLAIASEGRVKQISGATFVRKYNLPSASSVVSAVKTLMEKDFIVHEQQEYYVYDPFFQLWLEKTCLT